MKEIVYVIREAVVDGIAVQEEAVIKKATGGFLLRKRLDGKYHHFTIPRDEAMNKISKVFRLDAGE